MARRDVPRADLRDGQRTRLLTNTTTRDVADTELDAGANLDAHIHAKPDAHIRTESDANLHSWPISICCHEMTSVIWLSLLLAGAAVLVVSRVNTFGLGLALFTLIGLFITGANVTIGTLMLRATPRSLLGRVNSVITPAMNAGILVATALTGYLDSQTLRGLHLRVMRTTFGPVDTIYTFAGLLFVASAFVVMAGLRGPDRQARV